MPGPVVALNASDDGAPVTPSDSTDLDPIPRAVYVGVAGTLSVITAAGVQRDFGTIVAGTLLPLRVKRIRATGTTATNIAVLF